MTILEYAEKIDYLKYLSNDMIDNLNEWQKAYDEGIDLNMVFGLRNGKVLLSTLIQKYAGYMEGYKDGKAEAIDEFVAFANTLPTVEDEEGYIRPMRLEEMAEQLKEKDNE